MNVDFIDEAREIATTRVAMYKARMAKAYNARVRPRNFQVGDLVLRKRRLLVLWGSWTRSGKNLTKSWKSLTRELTSCNKRMGKAFHT
ncbi:UNVERIFIED_CONTAM: hypothetical protein Sangu_2984100 [Sesamum angustifolium]|uniref:Uncharacterized protein n=1 Tax=Sesamum angustifolium TaxID=2727405 RepID=A0AAW2IIU3_9LAMI